VKTSLCCLPDNESYDYRSHSKTKNQDTDLLTGLLLIKEEKNKATDTRNRWQEEKASLPVNVANFGELEHSIPVIIQEK